MEQLHNFDKKPAGFGENLRRQFYAFRLIALEQRLRPGSYDHGHVQVTGDRRHTTVRVWTEHEDDTLQLTSVKFTRDEVTLALKGIEISIEDVGENTEVYPADEAQIVGKSIAGQTEVLADGVKAMKTAARTIQNYPPDRTTYAPEVN
jgi:hypothetical protein